MNAGWAWLIVAAAMLATSAALLVGAALVEAREKRRVRQGQRMDEIRRRRMARGEEP